MTQDVLVTVTGLMIIPNPEKPIEIISRGKYSMKNGKHYIQYEEMDEGLPGLMIHNTVKVSPDQVDIIRTGGLNVHMIFAKGRSSQACYDGPFGRMIMGIDTKDISVKNEEEELSINLKYGLNVNYTFLSDYDVTIRVGQRKHSE